MDSEEYKGFALQTCVVKVSCSSCEEQGGEEEEEESEQAIETDFGDRLLDPRLPSS